jgi:hypothetical protein
VGTITDQNGIRPVLLVGEVGGGDPMAGHILQLRAHGLFA